MLQELKDSQSNKSIRRFVSPKYVFIVDRRANKAEIADALEEIYAEQKIKVISVNTINVKSKVRRVRKYVGNTSNFKKAIVTLQEGDLLDNV
jgi:large subunit ribosomal protein L23